MSERMEPREVALSDQAQSAAREIYDRLMEQAPNVRALMQHEAGWLIPMLAVAWLEGRQAGGDEAKAVVRSTFARLTGDES